MFDGKKLSPIRRYRWWLTISAVTAVALSIGGLNWYHDFGAHIVAEGIGIAASVPVTVVVVEGILDRRRTAEWALVRQQTGRNIEGIAQQAAFDFHLALRPDQRQSIPSPAVLPVGGHAPALYRIAAALREREGDEDSAVERLQTSLDPLLGSLLDRMGPRVYASSDPTLVQRFGQVEEAARAWERFHYFYTSSGGVPLGALWSPAADTAAALASLVKHAGTITNARR